MLREIRPQLLALIIASLSASLSATPWCSPAPGQELGTPAARTQPQSSASLIPLGTTYSRAQAATWLDAKRFVVGRWDGTITVFRTMSTESEVGPALLTALTTPSKLGLEMLASLGDGSFVSSNDAQSMVLWRQVDNGFVPQAVAFLPEYGTAVSAILAGQPAERFLLVGHQHGFLTIWRLGDDPLASSPLPTRPLPTQPAPTQPAPTRPAPTRPTPRLIRAVSLRSGHPIAWQWQTWHVRGLATCGLDRVVSVAEDGDICLLKVPSGKILSRRRYNATAQRGMNDVAAWGDLVAVVNCAVGSKDRNLWIYQIEGNSLEHVASQKLVLDKTRDPVFAFSVEMFEFEGEPHFAASTEEGLIWLGMVKDNKIVVLGQERIARAGAAVLAWEATSNTLLAVGHKLQTMAVGPRPLPHEPTQP